MLEDYENRMVNTKKTANRKKAKRKTMVVTSGGVTVLGELKDKPEKNKKGK